MRLRDHYDGGDDPFEGERTIVWRSLPENALITKATLTLTPRLPPGRSSYIETLTFAGGGARGATIRQVASGTVEIDFHARRTPVGFTGLSAGVANALSVDIGGGVFLGVSQDGTVPGVSPFYDLQSSALPGIGALRIRLAGLVSSDAATLALAAVTIASMPSNVTARFGKLLPFWSKVGDLAVPTMTSDITDSVLAALAEAAVENGFYAVPLIVHSDTLGRVAATLDVEYFGVAPLMPAGLREVVLAYDYATIAKASTKTNGAAGSAAAQTAVLQATLPAGSAIVPAMTSLQVRGAFEASRIVQGPTGATAQSNPIRCAAGECLAQPFVPDADINVSAVDVLVAALGPAATLAVDLRNDFDGKPGQTSLLTKPARFDVAGDASGELRWVSVPVGPARLEQDGKLRWMVVQALDGDALIGVDAAPAAARLPQRSTNAGFSWRAASIPSRMLMRLRTVPDRYTTPIELAAGDGANQQRASLRAYDPLGKIDAVISRPEIADAVQSAVTRMAPAACADVELLQNADFSQWRGVGDGLEAPASPLAIVTTSDKDVSAFVVDTFFDTVGPPHPLNITTPRALALSPDGAVLYVAAARGVYALDASNFSIVGGFLEGIVALGLAVDPRGALLYVLSAQQLVGISLATATPGDIAFDLPGARALAISRDGNKAYVAIGDTTPAVVALDLETGTEDFRISVAASALVLTAGDTVLVILDAETDQIASFDTTSGNLGWSAAAPQGFVPGAIAATADGNGVYVRVVPNGFAADKPLLLALDNRGRTTQSIALPAMPARAAMTVKPQGDKLYIADAPLAIDPAGSFLLTSTPIKELTVVAIGKRQPAAWTLTAGNVMPRPSSDDPPDIQALVDGGALSQVVAVAPGCFQDFAIEAKVGASWQADDFKPATGGTAEAVAEIFWLDAGGALLRGDTLALPASRRFVKQQARYKPPPASAQAEVRIRITDGSCLLRSVSLHTSDALLDAGAWQINPAARGVVVTSGAAATRYQNRGTADIALTQKVALATSTPYALDFRGSAVAAQAGTVPYVEFRYQDATGASLGMPQRLTLDAIGFSNRPASLSVPATAAAVEAAMVLPPGTGINAETVQLVPRPTTTVPVTFIAQSPGELHVTQAQVVYDWTPGAPPSPPPGGLNPPTPPGRTPGDPSCCEPSCNDEAPAAASVMLTATRAPMIMATRPLLQSAVREADPPLTSIAGIADGRAHRFAEAGILTARDLAASTPERVVAALAGTVGVTPELASILIKRASAALAMKPSGSI